MKLVRDKIPEIMRRQGKNPKTRIAEPEEFKKFLLEKLGEEIKEIKADQCIEELADAIEVIYAIGKQIGVNPEQIEEKRKQKLEKNGGFEKKIILESQNPD